jgi:hypothetical protein
MARDKIFSSPHQILPTSSLFISWFLQMSFCSDLLQLHDGGDYKKRSIQRLISWSEANF